MAHKLLNVLTSRGFFASKSRSSHLARSLMREFFDLKSLSKNSGFTLIELLIVIAILAALTGLVATNFGTTQGKARDARRKSDLTQIQKALELYYNDHGQYPHESSNQIAGCGPASQSVCPWGSALQDQNGTIYMDTIPKDPKSAYVYFYNVDQTNYLRYQLFALLENSKDPILDRDNDGNPDTYTKNCGAADCNYAATSPNTDGTASF